MSVIPNLKPLTPLQWNIRSCYTNRNDLNILIKDYNPDIIFLQETWLKYNYSFGLKNFNIYRNDREDGNGGVAVLYKNYIHLEIVESNIQIFPPNFQFQVVKLSNLTFINVYCPPNIQIKKEEWKEFVKSLESPKVIVGNFNGHNPAW